MALLRASETARPEAERVCFDPYARSFVNPITYLAAAPFMRAGLPDRLFLAGTMTFALAREQYVHDLIVSEAKAGLDQIVILGAGFDTRAYRTPETAGLPVFEVDHPVTQAAKREAIAGLGVAVPAQVAFVAVDFDKDDLGERLRSAGYREARRTLFVWQGVTMYLTPGGIDRTLAFIAGHSAPGSAVVFDYLYRASMASSQTIGMRFVAWAMGERVTFGIDAAEIGPFLESRGFSGVRNADGAELSRRYLTGRKAGRPMTEAGAIVSAQVGRSS
jgi:methyltransferase (TIGR00027 family)